MMTVTETPTRSPATSARAGNCPACGSTALEVFHEVRSVPTNSCILLDSAEEAMSYPRGDIRLAACLDCGFVTNVAFEPQKTEYSGRYEETQGFSPTFGRFHENLARRLIAKYGLWEKTVLEIGCGKGEFLMLLAELGNNRGIGIDPSVHLGRITGPAADKVTFIADFYNEGHGGQSADFVVCKMTLEHITDVSAFLGTLRRSLGDRRDITVFFQIPEAMRILRTCAFEDIYYEHCSYFTPGSLARLFRATGFDVLDLAVEYDGQYLTIEARPGSANAIPRALLPAEEAPSVVAELARTFPARCSDAQQKWRDVVSAARQAGDNIVLWGSGSKAVAMMTTLGIGDDIAGVTDINPFRQGHYMPGTGHRILAPEELASLNPDVVIAMNAVYQNEIRADLAKLGITPQLVSL